MKGDGASVVLETCPNVYSLGYLVFAAAGLKQVFGYEDRADTKFTEIFYRGPSDQKLSTIGDTESSLQAVQCFVTCDDECSELLPEPGDDVPRQQQPAQPQPRRVPALAQALLPHPREHHGREHCPLSGGGGSAIPSVLLRIMHLPSQEVGSQLRGLKIQCSGFDLSDIAVLCPNLKSLIIQKEAPNPGGEFNILRQSKLNV